MEWNELKDDASLQNIVEESRENLVLIFKHSIRCSISSMAINRLERSWNKDEVDNIKPYYLDLIQFRKISNEVSSTFSVVHQSPQVLVIKNGECIYDASHMEINYNDIKKLSGEISVN